MNLTNEELKILEILKHCQPDSGEYISSEKFLDLAIERGIDPDVTVRAQENLVAMDLIKNSNDKGLCLTETGIAALHSL